jgi:plasmid stability protein
MSSITIHELDEELDRRLSDEARRRKRSKNALVKDLLARSLGLPTEGPENDDYAEFCGLWSSEERQAFDTATVDNERIDDAEWR